MGGGDVTVVFIHGNLASKDWIELAAPLFPSGVRVIGIDWRGCGESDRPPPAADFSNYSMRQHALDMLAALDELQIPFCHLATHSTGGIIAARMLLKQPDGFWTGVRTRSGHAAGHVLQRRTDRPVSLDDDEPGGDARGDGHRCGFSVRSRGALRQIPYRAFAKASLRSRRSTNAFWSRPSVCPRASGSVPRTTSTWSGRAATSLRVYAGNSASAPGAVGREGWLDRSSRSQDYGSSHAGLPPRDCARYWAFDEFEKARSLRRILRCLVRGLGR